MFSISKYTSRGGRKNNEDFARVYGKGERLCALCCDGLGGHGGGEIASRAAVRCIRSDYKRDGKADKNWLTAALNHANAKVNSLQNEKVQMKTTAAAVVIDGDRACFGHIGDTRIYHFYNNTLIWQSTDHSMSQLAVMMGEIAPEEIRSHPERNRLTRALGGSDIVTPEVGDEIKLEPGRHAFLLCSDGFWEYVLENEMAHDLSISPVPRVWLKRMRLRLRRRAPENNDNNTAVAVFADI